MLFSNEQVAARVNQNFEPAWDMVRPVPIIHIDFGNGHVVTRTLHGNVASHICTPDGQVMDILPGIYTPTAYLAALEDPRRLAVNASRSTERLATLRAYHGAKAAQVRNRSILAAAAQARAAAAPRPRLDVGKGRVEMRVEQIVMQPAVNGFNRPRPGQNLANWELLNVDTMRNETERRLQIHDRLANASATRPEHIKFWLYKHVLHADLNDPYLGLGDAVVGDDIFRDFEG